MESLRTINRQVAWACVFLLSLSVVWAQGVTLHTHHFDHDTIENHHSESIDTAHKYSASLHISSDLSHEPHHESFSAEQNACPDCLVKSLYQHTDVVALILTLVALIASCAHSVVLRPNYRANTTSKRLFYTPPLRAPPQQP